MAGESRNELEIATRTLNGAAIVALRGEIDLHSSPGLRKVLLDYVQQKTPRLIIDLSAVTYVDSSGVGTLVELKRKLDRQRGQVVLVGVQPRVKSVFEITQLDKFFEMKDQLPDG